MELEVCVLRLSAWVEWSVFLNLDLFLAQNTHSIAHEVVDQSLASVQVCAQVVADLNQPVSFRFELV